MSVTSFKTASFLKLTFIIIIFVILAFVPLIVGGYYVRLIMTILYWTVLAVSWDFFSGSTRYISLASASFFGVGVYATAIFGYNLPYALVICINSLLCFLIAILIGLVSLRLTWIYFSIFTFGLSLLLRETIYWLEINIAHTVGRYTVYFDLNTVYYNILLISIVSVSLLALLRRTKLGLALKLIGENERTAVHIGINNTLFKVLGFAISSTCVGAIGSCLATQWTYVDPRIAFDPLYSFMPIVMSLMGGLGTEIGPVIGAIVLSLLAEVLLIKLKEYYMLLFGLILVTLVMFFPQGIIGALKGLRKSRLSSNKS
ncbi:MAG: branched-chain amino acid ABC transporter permease [Candidatus Bathyarchaeia archaeon]